MLIEKDWLSFGHKFQDRCGHVISDANEVSPIFLQFLDAVWQLTQMFPQAFQFNEKYLVTILEHTYSCQYGTFIGNCEKQRGELKIREKSYSLWGYLVMCNDEFVNPLYERSSVSEVLRPNLSPQNIKFWRGLYCRHENVHPREPLDLLTITQNHTTSLEDHGKMLSKTIQDVASKLGGAKAGGMFRSMMSSTSTKSLSSALSNSLPSGKSSVQEGAFIDDDPKADDVDDVGVEAALLEAAYDEEDIEAKFQATSLNSTRDESTSFKK